MNSPKHTNNLIHASSPYLLQHAHNPVHWYEWGEAAFTKARNEDKLVLISIGYSACHWCHVMERECFEQEDTASIMNEHFVCIKVDREERPDIDQIYMDAVQLLTGRGGWPLNCFTLPDGKPIHGGTYFPKKEWERVLQSLAQFYATQKVEAIDHAVKLTAGIQKLEIAVSNQSNTLLSKEAIDEVFAKWEQQLDLHLGGYNWAPKFPMPNNWECFLQYGVLTENPVWVNATHITLQRMGEGGIYDQLGGGFARYSTDSFWKVPHFEKMLYDNAQLMGLYAQAYRHTPLPLYKQVVAQTHQFIQQELTNAEGLFYSALDADSEGIEGKYYVWTQAELREVLGDDEPIFSLYYTVDRYGNWEHGVNILYRTRTDAELEQLTGKTIASIEQIIADCTQKLLAIRDQRIAPGLDDKCIVSWNALMIKGYAEAYQVFGDEAYLNAAIRAATKINQTLWDGKQLFRIYKNGKVSVMAFAEDYATLAEAYITLFEASGNPDYVYEADKLLQVVNAQYADEQQQLFYFTSSIGETLITRKLDTRDDVIPSANSILAKVLLRLGFYLEKPAYIERVDTMLQRVQSQFGKHTSSYTNWLQVLLMRVYGLKQVVVVGAAAPEAKFQLVQSYFPNTLVLALTQQNNLPLLASKQLTPHVQYHICTDFTCQLPVGTLAEAKRLLF